MTIITESSSPVEDVPLPLDNNEVITCTYKLDLIKIVIDHVIFSGV